MTVEEAKKAFEELRAQGQSDEEILAGMYLMFVDGEMEVDDLEKLAGVLGYEFSDDFKKMSTEEKKAQGYRTVDEKAENVSKDEVDDAKELTKDEKTEVAEAAKDEEEAAMEKTFAKDDEEKAEEKADDEDDGKDKEDEETRARKLFGFDK